ncbi:MAG: AsmA family protein, partial [Ferrovibrionaceae bacterium]
MRLGLTLKILAGVVVVLAAGIGIFVATFDVDRYKPQLIAAAKEATGRDLTIDGKLALSLFPRLALTADKVRFANAPWGTRPEMASVGAFAVEVEAGKLIIDRQLVIDRLALSDVDLLLETSPDGKANWAFEKPGAASVQPQGQGPGQQAGASGGRIVPEFRSLSLEKVKLTYRNGVTKQVREANVIQFDMSREAADRIAAKFNAEINGAPVELAGTVGRFDDLLDTTPW